MNTFRDWIPCAAIRQPSMNRCGARRMISRSLNAPGSDSSAFATTYAGLRRLSGVGTRLIFRPIAKPAPPRPRSFAFVIVSITCSGDMARAFSSCAYPPSARYSSSFVRSRSCAPLRTVSSAATDLLHERRDVGRVDRLAVALVDDDHRRVAASARTLDRPEGDRAVLRRLPGTDAELLLEGVDDRLRADERAGEVRADLDRVPADRRQV